MNTDEATVQIGILIVCSREALMLITECLIFILRMFIINTNYSEVRLTNMPLNLPYVYLCFSGFVESIHF